MIPNIMYGTKLLYETGKITAPESLEKVFGKGVVYVQVWEDTKWGEPIGNYIIDARFTPIRHRDIKDISDKLVSDINFTALCRLPTVILRKSNPSTAITSAKWMIDDAENWLSGKYGLGSQ